MAYRTLFAHVIPHGDNEAVLAVTASLSRRFGADITGIAVAQPSSYLDDVALYGNAAAALARPDGSQIEQDLAACESDFRSAMKNCRGEIEWRSVVTTESLAAAVAREARSCDLIITAPTAPLSAYDNSTRVNVGALAIRAGRPVLVVPRNVMDLAPRNILVAWKDTREARRALSDALPLLLEAERVTVLEIAGLDDLLMVQARLDDVARWLARHGVRAVAEAVTVSSPENEALGAEIAGRAPDLVVAGAYGHSRMNEWVFGGATRDVLLNAGCSVLLSN